MSSAYEKFGLIADELTSLAKKIYPESHWQAILKIDTPNKWLRAASEAGIHKDSALRLLANKYQIPYREASELTGKGVWVPAGVFIEKDSIFYSRELTPSHFQKEGAVTFGLMIGDAAPSKYPEAINSENEEAKDIIRGLYASIMTLSKPECKYTHFSLTGHHLSALCGTKDVLYKRLDEGFTPLLEMSHKRASKTIGEQIWSDACHRYVNYIKLNPTRRFSFFTGEMSESILETMKKVVESSSIFKVVAEIPDSPCSNTVAVVDFDRIDSLSKEDLYALTRVHTLFYSREKTMPRLYGRMRQVLGKENLISHLAVYSSRVIGTKVCQNCCDRSETPIVLTDSIYSLSFNVKRPPIVGPGCSSCVSGYAGSVLLTEDCFTPGVAGAAVHSFEVDEEDRVRAETRDPFKIRESIVRTKKVDLVLTKLESLVTSGQITVEDAQNLLN